MWPFPVPRSRTNQGYLIAASLVKKLKEGRLHLPRITKALDSLEGALVKFCGQELLDGWRKEEKEWLEKVVIVEEKKNLPNPYDLVQPSGTCRPMWSVIALY